MALYLPVESTTGDSLSFLSTFLFSMFVLLVSIHAAPHAHVLQILSAVKVNFVNCDEPMYAGQPVLVHVVIHNSFHWGSVGHEEPEFRMRYDVEEHVKDWLISGRKRGDFITKVFLELSHRACSTNSRHIGWRGTCRSSHSHSITSWRVSSTTGDGPPITYAECARNAERKPSASKLGVLSI